MKKCLAILGGTIFLIFTIILGGLTAWAAIDGFYGLAIFFGIGYICALVTLMEG